MVALHRQKPVVEHHMTCLLLHWTLLLSFIFPFSVKPSCFSTWPPCQTSFPLLRQIAHPFLSHAYIAVQGTFIDIVFGHMLLFLTPLSKCSANILLLSWNISVWSHSLSVHQLLRRICAWSKGTNWPKSDLWYCSEQKVIPTRKNRKAWLRLAELHHNFPLLSAEELHRVLSQEESIFQLNIYFNKQREGLKHNTCCLLGQDTSLSYHSSCPAPFFSSVLLASLETVPWYQNQLLRCSPQIPVNKSPDLW